MFSGLRSMLRSVGPVRQAVIRLRGLSAARGQSDEGTILRRLVDRLDAPRTFIEFGFHPNEFNCASLIDDFEGLLIDGDRTQVAVAAARLPARVRARHQFITLDTLEPIRTAFDRLGVLSIDVDGNDYWFLEALIDLAPAVICVEYNPSLGHEPVTVPYDPAFSRHEKHPSGWYHGASLAALANLAARHGYGLAAISEAGGNAFFTRDGDLPVAASWKPSRLRDRMSGTTAAQQWAMVKDLPLVHIAGG